MRDSQMQLLQPCRQYGAPRGKKDSDTANTSVYQHRRDGQLVEPVRLPWTENSWVTDPLQWSHHVLSLSGTSYLAGFWWDRSAQPY